MSSIDERTTEIERQSERPKILIVDDKQRLRDSLRNLLEAVGYSVDAAPDGATALRSYLEQRPTYGLIITDLEMPPGMNGIELAREICARGNGVPIVLSSGNRRETKACGARQEYPVCCPSHMVSGSLSAV